jgi:hypothetical protein
MSKDEVIHYVGEPRTRSYDDHFEKGRQETWFFDFYEPHTREFEPHWVRFVDGRVTACELDKARLDEVKREAAERKHKEFLAQIIPPDIGFKCDDGTQCRSGKCLEHKCAGPRDCTRAPGDPCNSPLDCCTLRCNMGARTCL